MEAGFKLAASIISFFTACIGLVGKIKRQPK